MRMASACDAAGLPPPSSGSADGRLLQLLIMASSSGEATMEFTPKAATSMPRICPVDWESSSFSACASSLVCAGTAEYRTHCRDARKCRLQCREQLALELRVYFVSRVGLLDVAAHVLVEHDGSTIRYEYSPLQRTRCPRPVQCCCRPRGRHRRRRPVLVAHNLLGVEEVDALVLARVTPNEKRVPTRSKGFLIRSPNEPPSPKKRLGSVELSNTNYPGSPHASARPRAPSTMIMYRPSFTAMTVRLR